MIDIVIVAAKVDQINYDDKPEEVLKQIEKVEADIEKRARRQKNKVIGKELKEMKKKIKSIEEAITVLPPVVNQQNDGPYQPSSFS